MEIYIPQVPSTGSDTQTNPNGYIVQPGDTLESIAAQFGVEINELIAANFKDGSVGELVAGQELEIPLDPNVTGFIEHNVKRGDTKENIATQYQVSENVLLRANPSLANTPTLPPNFLVKIPQFTANKADEANKNNNLPDSYTMKLGDTLAEIAKKHGVSTEELKKANPEIADINKNYPGMVIKFAQSKKPLEENNSQIKDSFTAGVGFDNFSKLRFQMMGNQKLLDNPLTPPGFGTNQTPINQHEEEQEKKPDQKRRPAMPAPFDKWAEFIYLAAEKYAVEASLIAAIIWQESGGNNIIGKNGHGCGLMQIDDRRYNDWLRSNQQGLDPATNIDFGTSIVKKCLDHFRGDPKLALAAYSVGIETIEWAMKSNLPDMIGSRYAFDVLSQQEYFRKFFED